MTGIAISAGLSSSRRASWWQSGALLATDNGDGLQKAPAFVADFRCGRHALTTVAAGEIAAAGAGALSALRPATFAELFTFARAGAAAEIGLDGLPAIVASGVPRHDYRDGIRRLLVESAATQLSRNNRFVDWAGILPLGYAQSVSNTALYEKIAGQWGDNALRLKGPSSNSSQRITASLAGTLANSKAYTVSVRLRKSRGSGAATLSFAIDGWSGSAFSIDATALPIGEWRIVSATGVTPAAGTFQSVGLHTNNTDADIDIDWWQIEAGTIASSPILNDGQAAVVRPAETCRLSAAGEALLSRDAATVVVTGAYAWPSGVALIGRTGQALLRTAAGNVQVQTLAPGGTLGGLAIAAASGFSGGLAFGGEGRTLAADGASLSDGTVPATVAPIYLGGDGSAAPGFGSYERLLIYPFRVADSDLRALTA